MRSHLQWKHLEQAMGGHDYAVVHMLSGMEAQHHTAGVFIVDPEHLSIFLNPQLSFILCELQ